MTRKCTVPGCGSYAVNDGQDGRPAGERLDRCDVHYWRDVLGDEIDRLRAELARLPAIKEGRCAISANVQDSSSKTWSTTMLATA